MGRQAGLHREGAKMPAPGRSGAGPRSFLGTSGKIDIERYLSRVSPSVPAPQRRRLQLCGSFGTDSTWRDPQGDAAECMCRFAPKKEPARVANVLIALIGQKVNGHVIPQTRPGTFKSSEA